MSSSPKKCDTAIVNSLKGDAIRFNLNNELIIGKITMMFAHQHNHQYHSFVEVNVCVQQEG